MEVCRLGKCKGLLWVMRAQSQLRQLSRRPLHAEKGDFDLKESQLREAIAASENGQPPIGNVLGSWMQLQSAIQRRVCNAPISTTAAMAIRPLWIHTQDANTSNIEFEEDLCKEESATGCVEQCELAEWLKLENRRMEHVSRVEAKEREHLQLVRAFRSTEETLLSDHGYMGTCAEFSERRLLEVESQLDTAKERDALEVLCDEGFWKSDFFDYDDYKAQCHA